MNAVRSNNVSLKYIRFTSSGYKVIGFTKIEFVAKSQFLSGKILKISLQKHILVKREIIAKNGRRSKGWSRIHGVNFVLLYDYLAARCL